MIEIYLTQALRELVEEAVKDFRLPVEKGETRAPKVINGYLPPKQYIMPGQTARDDDFPFVVVRADKATSNKEETQVDVSIIIGCYSKEFDGHEYCLNVMSRIRNALTSLENGILAGKYILSFPIEWDLVPEQPYPQWQLDMTTHWVFNTPKPITNF